MKLCILLFAGAAAFAASPDAAELVRSAAARYASAEAWDRSGVTTIRSGAASLEIHTESAAAPGRRERLSMRHPRTTLLYVSDGERAAACAGQLNQCAVSSLDDLDASAHYAYGSPGAVRSRLRALLDPRYSRIAGRAARARIVGAERLPSGDAFVVRLGPPVLPDDVRQEWTVWIGRADGIIWKDEFVQRDAAGSAVHSTTVWKRMALAAPPARLFRLDLPRDAAVVATLDLPPPPPTVRPGLPPPAFELPGLDGAPVSLAALRGKVVLVDFWTTWCPPCRKELPSIEKLHREFGSRGFVALGISDEQPDVVRRFRAENGLTFPTVIDENGHTALAYLVYSLPTSILIDRSGKVVRLFVGDQTEATLRAAVAAVL